MCPMCIATTAWVAAGAAGTGGLSMLAIRWWRLKTVAMITTPVRLLSRWRNRTLSPRK